jgi:quercetin dioxygenase-like cupin family protein
MKSIDALSAARAAVTANPGRPAMAIIHDSDDVRMVVFRIGPGQRVAPHTSKSTVLLRVLEGTGVLSGADGEERTCSRDDMVVYERGELHGMAATDEELIVMATIAPRPGSR